MSREVDQRQLDDHPINVLNRELEASSLQAASTGVDYVQRALTHLQNRDAQDLVSGPSPEYRPDPHAQYTTSGAVSVHFQQEYKGIPIYGATETVRFAPHDPGRQTAALQETVGSTWHRRVDLPVAPTLTAAQAVQRAAAHVATPSEDEYGCVDPFGAEVTPVQVDISGFIPELLRAGRDLPIAPATFAPGPFGAPIPTSLIWFPLGGILRLTWDVLLTMPAQAGQYYTIIDAQSGMILYCTQLMQTATTVRGRVFPLNGAGAREWVTFPQPLDVMDLPPSGRRIGFPDPWLEGQTLDGNCVKVRLATGGLPYSATTQADTLIFDPDPQSAEQLLLNLFYYNCFIHDFFYLLGFTEQDGNFQQIDHQTGGRVGDEVQAFVHLGGVYGTASLITPPDSPAPIMNMGLATNTNRHTALDAGVVFHEFTHGVTNRLVGGLANKHALEAIQSAGMGEGWGDYIACTITASDVVGAWVVANPHGIRGYPYTSAFPDHFGHLGQGRYQEIHNIGEIWCATLLEMNRQIGKTLGLQLVIDALKLAPANPSFLDMRDAILLALTHMQTVGRLPITEYAQQQAAIWAVFAHFGMGPKAHCIGATLEGIVPDFAPSGVNTGPAARKRGALPTPSELSAHTPAAPGSTT